MTGVGTILGGAFGLLAGRPVAVLVWMAIYAALGAVSILLLAGALPGMFEAMSHANPADPEAFQLTMMQSMGSFQGLSWLLNLLGLFVGAVVMCAAYRAVVRPEDGGLAFLRIGRDEFRTFIMIVVIYFAAIILSVILFLILFLIAMVVAFAARDAPLAIGIVGCALALAGIAAVLYVAVRLSLIYAVSFIRGRLTIDEAWAITRGRFWTLSIAYFVIAAVFGIVSSVVALTAVWGPIGDLARIMPANNATMSPDEVSRIIIPWFEAHKYGLAGVVLVWSALQGIATALYSGAAAAAARGFMEDSGMLARANPPEA